MPKRKRKASAPNDTELDDPKRPRQTTENGSAIASQSVTYGRVDPTYGQRSAIPGLDDYSIGDHGGADADSDLEYGDAMDALRYLQSVRVEASSIPTLLVAPKRCGGGADEEGEEEGDVDGGIYENGVGDSRGWYEDGAYTAAPQLPSLASSSAGESRQSDPQAVYYESLLRRFAALRQKLARVPPRLVVERLDADHQGSHMSASVKDYKMWRWRVKNTDPVAAQLAEMDKESVLRLLRMVGSGKKGEFLIGPAGGKRMSLWVWGLLAKLPERGELLSEEIGVVRELGKRAVLAVVRLKGMDIGGLDEQEESEEGYEDEEVVDVEVDIVDDSPESANGEPGDDSGLKDGDDTVSLDDEVPADSIAPKMIGPIFPAPQLEDTPQQANSLPPPPATALGPEEDLPAARARLLARLSDHAAKVGADEADRDEEGGAEKEKVQEEQDEESNMRNFRATVDMIITVAGEVYGQRDLLEFREVWG